MNSIDIAAAALRRSDLRLIMVGGAVNYGVGGCVDAPAPLSLMQMNIDLGGAWGLRGFLRDWP